MVSSLSAFVLASFTAFFVTVNPIQGAALFPVLTAGGGAAYRRRMAFKSAAVATGILLVFALFGDDLLRFIGVSVPGVRVGGGVLLMLVSIDIVFGRSIGSPSRVPGAASAGTPDVSVFPLATPILAGPAAITAVTVRATEAGNEIVPTALMILALGVVMLLTLGALLAAAGIRRWLGETGMGVVTRVLGVLLTALSAEMILHGLRDSGIFTR